MAIKSTLFEDYNTAQAALNKTKKKTIKALNQVIADLNLQPHELTFPSAAEPTAPKGDEGGTEKTMRSYYYVKATKKIWFPAGVQGKTLPDGITRDNKKLVVDADKITVIEAIDMKEAKAKAAAYP